MDKRITSGILAVLAVASIACGSVGSPSAAQPASGGNAYLTSDTTYGVGGTVEIDHAEGGALPGTDSSAALQP